MPIPTITHMTTIKKRTEQCSTTITVHLSDEILDIIINIIMKYVYEDSVSTNASRRNAERYKQRNTRRNVQTAHQYNTRRVRQQYSDTTISGIDSCTATPTIRVNSKYDTARYKTLSTSYNIPNNSTSCNVNYRRLRTHTNNSATSS